jgi:tRNA(adenine34) deaminase
MNEALKEARQALKEDEIPIGAVVVCKGQIIGRGHNLTERLNDVSAHAEMQALTAAANYMGGKYLPECTLYVTTGTLCNVRGGILLVPDRADSFWRL